jgi:type IV pilus assembly protein PilA
MTRRSFKRGFTLVELMIVVAIVGVLGALGSYGVRKYIRAAQASEAGTTIASIRGAQEVYKQDLLVYYNVSSNSFDNAHPSGTPGAFKKAWATSSPTTASSGFQQLGVVVDGAVYFTYAVVAGLAGGTIPALPITANLNLPAPVEPYYVIVAKGDLDGDGVFSYVVGHSFSGETYMENEGE